MMKRIVSSILALTLTFVMSVPAFATDDIRMQLAQAEIESRVEVAMDAAQYQLSQIDPRYETAYREIITSRIEQEVLADYGITPTSVNVYSMDAGGIVTYQWEDQAGNGYYISNTLLTPEDATDIYPSNEVNVLEIIYDCLDVAYNHQIGNIYTQMYLILYNLICIPTNLDKQAIDRADGYVHITSVLLDYLPEADAMIIMSG